MLYEKRPDLRRVSTRSSQRKKRDSYNIDSQNITFAQKCMIFSACAPPVYTLFRFLKQLQIFISVEYNSYHKRLFHRIKDQLRNIVFLFNVNIGKKTNTPITDIINPPIVPAASGNQKPSFSAPTMKGIKPKIVETTVRKIGIILAFQALV